MDERYYDQSVEQKAIQTKYPSINKRFEYLDHTADVQLHAWGSTLQEAFEQVTAAMFCYITDLAVVEPLQAMEIEAEGGDMMSLLYNFMDAWLFNFCADPFFIPRELKVISLDRVNFKIRSIGWGEQFNLDKHPQGTEVKAITYSAMQIHEEKETNDIFVIIDI